MPPTTYHLRNESGIEVFTGSIFPAPGGGSQPTRNEYYTNTPESIADGATHALPINLSGDSDGDLILDLTDPYNPLVTEAGFYAITAVFGASELTPGGSYTARLGVDEDNVDANAAASVVSPNTVASIPMTYYMPAGGRINLSMTNNDGAAARTFFVTIYIAKVA